MPAAQQLTLKVLKSQFHALEERYPGYREDAASRLRVILQSVRQLGPAQARDRVATELQDFGDTMARKTVRAETTLDLIEGNL